MVNHNKNRAAVLLGCVITLIVAALGLLRPILIVAAIMGLLLTAVPLLHASTRVRTYVKWLFNQVGGR